MWFAQVKFPERALFARIDAQGVHASVHMRRVQAEIPALGLGIGPGARLLALGADRTLYELGGARAQPMWRSVEDFCADPLLLAAVVDEESLLLESADRCTSVTLPGRPLGIATLGGSGRLPHLLLLVLRGEAHLAAWDQEGGAVRTVMSIPGDFAQAALLEGEPALLAMRDKRSSGAPGAQVWQIGVGDGGPAATRLPDLLVEGGAAVGLRNPLDGPQVRCAQGWWAIARGRDWAFRREPSGGVQDFLLTRVYGRDAQIGPMPPEIDKEHFPRPRKLAAAPTPGRA